MTDNLKAMMRAAILDKASDGWSGDACAVDVDDALKAALQAIHDAGYVVLPKVPTEPMIWAGCRLTLPAMFKHGIHGLARDGEGTRRQMATVIQDVEKKYAAMIAASQPKTEGGET